MRIIALASRKGGAGKTTLAAHLAVEASSGGSVPVGVIDMDPMNGLSRWWDARQAPYPGLARPEPNLKAAIAAHRRAGMEFVFIDTPPAASDSVGAAVSASHLVIVPVQPSPDDLGAVGVTVNMINLARKALVFVINRTKPRVALTGQAAVVLSQHGTVSLVHVADRALYASAKTDGRVAQELDSAGPAAVEMRGLWEYLLTRLEMVR